jgi:hypothetical protein
MAQFHLLYSRSNVTRRQLFSGMALAGSGLLLGCTTTPPTYATGDAAKREAALAADAPTLIYVSNSNCSFCLAFDYNNLPSFEASKERQALRLVRLHSPSVSIPSRMSPWAESHTWALEAARDHGMLMQTPFFVLARGSKYIVSGYGLEDWQHDILPAVRREVGVA